MGHILNRIYAAAIVLILLDAWRLVYLFRHSGL